MREPATARPLHRPRRIAVTCTDGTAHVDAEVSRGWAIHRTVLLGNRISEAYWSVTCTATRLAAGASFTEKQAREVARVLRRRAPWLRVHRGNRWDMPLAWVAWFQRLDAGVVGSPPSVPLRLRKGRAHA